MRKIREETLNDKGTLLPGGQMALLLGLGAADPGVGSGTRMVEVTLGSGVSDSWAFLGGGAFVLLGAWKVGASMLLPQHLLGRAFLVKRARFHSLSISRAL